MGRRGRRSGITELDCLILRAFRRMHELGTYRLTLKQLYGLRQIDIAPNTKYNGHLRLFDAPTKRGVYGEIKKLSDPEGRWGLLTINQDRKDRYDALSKRFSGVERLLPKLTKRIGSAGRPEENFSLSEKGWNLVRFNERLEQLQILSAKSHEPRNSGDADKLRIEILAQVQSFLGIPENTLKALGFFDSDPAVKAVREGKKELFR
ncbi:MAG: hypothetical protein FJ149_05545 [Euryarchaeota archaeon]|nr:hypothetical protein [Euryarchaeota archaeon]